MHLFFHLVICINNVTLEYCRSNRVSFNAQQNYSLPVERVYYHNSIEIFRKGNINAIHSIFFFFF